MTIAVQPGLRTCPRTPHKVKFFTFDDARKHIARTADHCARPRRPYRCDACGWVHTCSTKETP